MRVSEIFEPALPGACGKPGPVAGAEEWPARAFESVLAGSGPVAAAQPARPAGGAETPRPSRGFLAALDAMLAPEGMGEVPAEGVPAGADPSAVGLASVAAARDPLEEALAEALALRQQAEGGADATVAPIPGLAVGSAPMVPVPGERGAVANDGAAAGGAGATPGMLPASVAQGVYGGAPERLPPVPQSTSTAGTAAAAEPAVPAFARDATAASGDVVALGAEAQARPADRVPQPGYGDTAEAPGDARLPRTFGPRSDAEATLADARRETREPHAAAEAMPRRSDDEPVQAPGGAPARPQDGAAAPDNGTDDGAPVAGDLPTRRAAAVRAGASGDPAAWAGMPGHGAVRSGAALDRVPDSAGSMGSALAAGAGAEAVSQPPDRADGAPIVAAGLGPGNGPAVPDVASRNALARREAPHDAAEGALPRDPAASAPMPAGEAAAGLGGPPLHAGAPEAAGSARHGPEAPVAKAPGAEAAHLAPAPDRQDRSEVTARDGAPADAGDGAAAAPAPDGGTGDAAQRMPMAAPAGLLPEAPGGPHEARGLHAAPHTTPEARTEIGARAAEQAATALTASHDGRIELRLDPEELGPVRLGLAPGDGTITVQISAERGETMDLMRRHADVLARELRQAGYGEVSFQFGADTASGGGSAPRHGYATPQSRGAGEASPGDPAAAATARTPAAPRALAPGALDLRL
jgi:flagellar hook-length control protein FliK